MVGEVGQRLICQMCTKWCGETHKHVRQHCKPRMAAERMFLGFLHLKEANPNKDCPIITATTVKAMIANGLDPKVVLDQAKWWTPDKAMAMKNPDGQFTLVESPLEHHKKIDDIFKVEPVGSDMGDDTLSCICQHGPECFAPHRVLARQGDSPGDKEEEEESIKKELEEITKACKENAQKNEGFLTAAQKKLSDMKKKATRDEESAQEEVTKAQNALTAAEEKLKTTKSLVQKMKDKKSARDKGSARAKLTDVRAELHNKISGIKRVLEPKEGEVVPPSPKKICLGTVNNILKEMEEKKKEMENNKKESAEDELG